MEKQRKDDLKCATNIDIKTSIVENPKLGNRVLDDEYVYNKGFNSFYRFLINLVDKPAGFAYEKITELRGKRPIYYHKIYKRVPTVDECYTDDLVCIYEANQQFNRDTAVDSRILGILKDRLHHCVVYHGRDDAILCEKIREDANAAEYNFEVKYGELGSRHRAQDAYMKQKHRLIIERRRKLAEEGLKKDDNQLQI